MIGGKKLEAVKGNFVEPTITSVPANAKILQHEIFVPILHTVKVFFIVLYIIIIIIM